MLVERNMSWQGQDVSKNVGEGVGESIDATLLPFTVQITIVETIITEYMEFIALPMIHRVCFFFFFLAEMFPPSMDQNVPDNQNQRPLGWVP